MPNPITFIDGYKLGHIHDYPENTQRILCNFTPRTTRTGEDSVVFVGLQHFIRRFLVDELDAFFNTPLDYVLDAYSRRVNGYLGPNNVGTDHIKDLWSLGYVPLEFKAFDEGASVPIGVPVLTVENTLDEFFWLPNYIETILSASLWLPITSATTARTYRRILEGYASKTGAPVEFVDFQGHDFSFRGMGSMDSAMLSGFGHLTSFIGTDTIPAIDFIEKYYTPVTPEYLIGASVAATEHSVMCAGGMETEAETYARLLRIHPSHILAVVSDTWDIWNVINNILPGLKDEIMGRDGKLVIRPDSGDPVKIICGDPDKTMLSDPRSFNESKGVVELLWDQFGGTINREGYKTLDSHVGVIYGDSITEERAEAILAGLEAKGFASDNIVLGIGSYTYQYKTRDTHGFAMKATWAQINGEGVDMFKDPVTDDGGKKSAKGRLAVLPGDDGKPYLVNQATPEQESNSLLKTVWKDGVWYRKYSIEDIRSNVRKGL